MEVDDEGDRKSFAVLGWRESNKDVQFGLCLKPPGPARDSRFIGF